MKKTIDKTNCLLLGVTGGIASGKTVVAGMLDAMGAKTIDFDLLAREVVEPRKPAWKDIVGFFGEEVLMTDNTLDRKKLSEIVFNDPKKRKELESFTHPVIGEEFSSRVKKIAKKDSEAIIQAVVPLLLEGNMQGLFHKLLVVHVPLEIQIQRLVSRDKISREQAEKIISSQLPIDEKVKLADFVIHNDRTLDRTREQVEQLWEALKKIQQDKK